MAASRLTRDRIPQLDGLRGVAALLVLVWHLSAFRHPIQSATPLDLGAFAVEVFFWLSGFLITRNLIEGRRAGLAFGSFLRRRVARLMPCYLACVVAVWFVDGWSAEIPWALTYLSNVYYSTVDTPSSLSHFWSLAVEEQFYLVWPILWLLLPRRWGPRATWALLPLSVAFAVALAAWWPADLPVERAIYRATPVCGFALAGGALVAVYEERARNARALGILAGVLLALGLMLRLSSSPVAPAFVLMLLAGSAFLAALAGVGRSILSSMPLRWLGLISYGAYVWHRLVFAAFFDGDPVQATVALMFAIGVAAISYYVLEVPARRLVLGFNASRSLGRMEPAPMKLALILLLIASSAFAGYEAGFGYQAHSPAPRYTYGSDCHRQPRRTTTTITRRGNRTRIETRRYYRDGGTARVNTRNGAWSARGR